MGVIGVFIVEREARDWRVRLDGSGERGTSDERLFAELYPALRRFAVVAKPAELDADDLVQEALVRALRVGRLSELDDPAAYLRRTIANLASNTRRQLGRRRRALSRLTDADGGAGASYPSDLQDLLRLRPSERAAVYLAVVEGLSHAEVGVSLGCSEAAARNRVSRALRRLRADLNEEVQGA